MGQDDLAVGVVMESVGEVVNAGAVNIIFGQAGGLSTTDNTILHKGIAGVALVSGDPREDDFFGHSLAVGRFTGGPNPDLAVGTPGAWIDGEEASGAVQVFLGDPAGVLTISQYWHLESEGIQGVANGGEEFGYALATGDFNGDDQDDLAVGVPGIRAIPEHPLGSGVVNVIYNFGGFGLSEIGSHRLIDILNPRHAFDRVGGRLTSGDFDLNGIDDLAIAGSLYDGSGVANSGAARVFYGTDAGLIMDGSTRFDAELAGGELQAGEEMGFALAAGAFRHPEGGDGLVMGAPGRLGWGGAVNNGGVYVAYSEFPFLDGFESGSLCAWSSVQP